MVEDEFPSAIQVTWVQFLGWKDSPGGGHGNPLQYSCLENPHGQRSLAGYSPWGHKELDMTKQLSTRVSLVWVVQTGHTEQLGDIFLRLQV